MGENEPQATKTTGVLFVSLHKKQQKVSIVGLLTACWAPCFFFSLSNGKAYLLSMSNDGRDQRGWKAR
jgi:hypothetical protein